MTQYKQPYLKKYKNKDSRTVCPSCGKKQCFTLYLSGETNEPINAKVGICNHTNSCGYHYTPKQFFIDNPPDTMERKEWKPATTTAPKPTPPTGYIPFEYVEKSVSTESNFVSFLIELFSHHSPDNRRVVQLCQLYGLGATAAKEVIFWQIDTAGKVRTGKIMQYNPETGKRQSVDWIHSRMIKAGKLPSDFNMTQCFFGEHLLKLKPAATIAIVESEKTAIIASGLVPEFVWIAAGNINGLSVTKANVLKGRNIVLYPDLGIKKPDRPTAFEIWSAKATEIKKAYNCKIIVSDLLETIATDTDRQNGSDIADYLIREMRATEPPPATIAPTPEPPAPPPESETVFIEPLPKVETGYIRHYKKPPESWNTEIEALEAFFNNIELPAEPIKLNSYTTIIDCSKFVSSHLATIRANNGIITFKPYKTRLEKLKKYLNL